MAELERLVQRLEADNSQFQRALRDSRDDLQRFGRVGDQTTRRTGDSFRRVGAAAVALRSALVTLAGALAVREVIQYADAYTQIQNRIRVATEATADLAATTQELFDIANRTRTDVDSLAQVYQRASLSASELGASHDSLLQFVELTGQALATQGSSAAQASGALIQLSQALGSGIVRAEEFNSILEGALPIAQAAARGIDEAGGSVARLRQLVIDGEISSREFFEAILSQAPEIGEAFSRTQATVGQALTVLNNSFVELVGTSDRTTGATNNLAQAILDLAGVMGDPQFQEFVQTVLGGIVSGAGEALRAIQDFAENTRREIEVIIDLAQDIGQIFTRELPQGVSEDLARELRGQGITIFDVRKVSEDIDAIIADLEGRTAELEVTTVVRPGEEQFPTIEHPRPPPSIPEDIAERRGVLAGEIETINRRNELLRNTALAHDEISAILRLENDLERQLEEPEIERLTRALRTQRALEEQRDAAAGIRESLLDLDRFEVEAGTGRGVIGGGRDEARRILARQGLEARGGELIQVTEAAAEANNAVDRIGRSAESAAAGGLTEMVFRAEDLNSAFGIVVGTLEQMAQIITRIAIEESLAGTGSDLAQTLLGFGGAAAGGSATPDVFGSTQGLFASFAQHGARTRAGQPFIVGEAGPELFVPDVTGEIIPRGEFGAGGGSVTNIGGPTFNIDARGADPSVVPRIEAAMDRKLAEHDARFLDQTARDPRRRSAMNIRPGGRR